MIDQSFSTREGVLAALFTELARGGKPFETVYKLVQQGARLRPVDWTTALIMVGKSPAEFLAGAKGVDLSGDETMSRIIRSFQNFA